MCRVLGQLVHGGYAVFSTGDTAAGKPDTNLYQAGALW